MRISDWRSDVCSSDLQDRVVVVVDDGADLGVAAEVAAKRVGQLRAEVDPGVTVAVGAPVEVQDHLGPLHARLTAARRRVECVEGPFAHPHLGVGPADRATDLDGGVALALAEQHDARTLPGLPNDRTKPGRASLREQGGSYAYISVVGSK